MRRASSGHNDNGEVDRILRYGMKLLPDPFECCS